MPVGEPPCAHELLPSALRLTSQANTDLFVDPAGDGTGFPDTGRLVGLPPDGDFALSARVSVDFGSTFDAGVLVVYVSERCWAKLCFEYSPQHRPTAVSVVTTGFSDDSNSFEVQGTTLWLRLTRSGRAWAFHASTDGTWWSLLRYFSLGEQDSGEPAHVGFMTQSPTGKGCSAVFDQITFEPVAPADLRDGS